jgi:hypothetical protein
VQCHIAFPLVTIAGSAVTGEEISNSVFAIN